jgi:DNA-binding CsgD family transcriptional regulator
MTNRTPLSPRELEILRLSSYGQSAKQIAYELHITHATVTTLLARASQKLGATCKTHAVALAIRGNLL